MSQSFISSSTKEFSETVFLFQLLFSAADYSENYTWVTFKCISSMKIIVKHEGESEFSISCWKINNFFKNWKNVINFPGFSTKLTGNSGRERRSGDVLVHELDDDVVISRRQRQISYVACAIPVVIALDLRLWGALHSQRQATWGSQRAAWELWMIRGHRIDKSKRTSSMTGKLRRYQVQVEES